jgi:hypothetical protein
MSVVDAVTNPDSATPWHALPADDVARRLATRVDTGLDAGEARTRG